MQRSDVMEASTFRLVNAEVRELTLELAQAFHDLEPSPTERELSKARLTMLREKAKAKQLITFHWAKALFNNKWIRVNGQHSSQMLIELDGEFPTGLKVHIDEYEVSDRYGLGLLFRQFDDKKSGRSSSDIAGAYQNLEPALQEVPRPTGKLAVEGVTFYRQEVAHSPTPSGDAQYTLFHEMALHPFFKWTAEVFSIKTPEMKRKGVIAAMFSSFAAHPDEARRFWDIVARGGDQYDETAPTTVLDSWLKALTDKEQRQMLKLTAAQEYQGCIYAYNAFRRGQALKQIKYDFKAWQEPLVRAA
jgi:hypothetical protein